MLSVALHPPACNSLQLSTCQVSMTGDSFQDPSSLWVISETPKTSTPILRTKGEWDSWEGREQFPLLHRSRVTALTRLWLCRPQEGDTLAGWELSSSYSPSQGSDALDGWPGTRR